MISIPKCPITKLDRVVDYEFYWFKMNRQIHIKCVVYYLDEEGNQILDVKRLEPYPKPLIASDTLVDRTNGRILSAEEIADYELAVAAQKQYETDLQQYEWQINHPPPLVGAVQLIAPVQPPPPTVIPIKEYDFYAYVLGVTEINLPQLIESVIVARAQTGALDI